MALTTQSGAVTGRPLRYRYGPATAQRARMLLPGMMALREREAARQQERELAEAGLAQQAQAQNLAEKQFKYQQKAGEKAEDIGLVGMGAEIELLRRRNELQAGMTTAPQATTTTTYDTPVRTVGLDAEGKGTNQQGGYNAEGSAGGGRTWQDTAMDPGMWGKGLSGGLIGAGIGRRFEGGKDKRWGSILGGAAGGGLMGASGGGGIMGGAIGALIGGAAGGLLDALL